MNYPKIEKTITGSFTEWSKKIMTKKVAWAVLWWALLFSHNPSANAGITTNVTPALPYPATTDWSGHNNYQWPVQMTIIDSSTCSHASGIVNGHYSSIPNVNSSYTTYDLSSHWNHWNHCSCSRWM